jgi:rod shape-determining protein MreD
MNRITFFFFYTLCLALLFPPLFPNLRLLFFAPFLVITFYNENKNSSVRFALLSGLIIDLLSGQMRLGVQGLNYCITTLCLYPYKRHFFEDSISTFPIMTFLFSVLSTLIQIPLLSIFGTGLPLSANWIWNDLIVMPLIDALYAAFAFTLPYLFLPKTFKKKPALFSGKGRYP